MANHLPLCPLQREADAGVTMVGMDTHHMRAMLWARTIGRELDAGETKDEADECIVLICTRDQTAVVDGGDQHMRRNHIRFAAGPDGAVQRLNSVHVFRGFENLDKRSSHKRCPEQVEGLTRRAKCPLESIYNI